VRAYCRASSGPSVRSSKVPIRSTANPAAERVGHQRVVDGDAHDTVGVGSRLTADRNITWLRRHVDVHRNECPHTNMIPG